MSKEQAETAFADYREEETLTADEKAIAYIMDKYSLDYRSLLDLDCGSGARMPLFSMLFSSVTGLESDEALCEKAMQRILDEGLENATALCMDLKTYAQEFSHQGFDVVICATPPDARSEREWGIILEELDKVMHEDCVCLFASAWSESRLRSYGLKILERGELFTVCEAADRMLLRRRNAPEPVSGRMSLLCSYILEGTPQANRKALQAVQAAEDAQARDLRSAFEASADERIGEGPCPEAVRAFRTVSLKTSETSAQDICVISTLYPNENAAQVCISLTLEDASCDTFVLLRKALTDAKTPILADGRVTDLASFCEDLLSANGWKAKRKGCAVTMTELNVFGTCVNAHKLSTDDLRCLYGMLTGDEGYAYVPSQHIDRCMGQSWGDRSYMRVFSVDGHALMLCLDRRDGGGNNADEEKPFVSYDRSQEYAGAFVMRPAGLRRGAFFALERALLLRMVADFADAGLSEGQADGALHEHAALTLREKAFSALESLQNILSVNQHTIEAFLLRDFDADSAANRLRDRISLADHALTLLHRKRMRLLLAVLSGIALAVLVLLFFKL